MDLHFSYLLKWVLESQEDGKISDFILDVHITIGTQCDQFDLIWYSFLSIQD